MSTLQTFKTRLPIRATAALAALALACTPAFAGAMGETETPAATDDTAITQQVKDAWLEGRIESAMLFNEHLNSFAIDTSVDHGKATLTGTVESDIDRDLAGEITRLVDGVDSVDNRLTVDEKAGEDAKASESHRSDWAWRQGVMDASITAEVKTRLLLNDNVSGLAIDVDTHDGVVTLSGSVDSAEASELAATIAANVGQTAKVDNRLTVDAAKSS